VEDPEIIDSQFLRINVRHVTDGAGVVVGSILITPKVLMFNPNLSDQLVEESEPDKYQVSSIFWINPFSIHFVHSLHF
jgi:hypothetical protein